MTYKSEKQYFYVEYTEFTPDYLIHKCYKSKCKIGIFSKYKIWEYQGKVQGQSIILDNCLTTYKVVSRYDLNATLLNKVKTEISFNDSVNVVLKNIIELNSAIKIDLANPISSGLQIIDKLLKLRAFS
jgi:hypothetical protein